MRLVLAKDRPWVLFLAVAGAIAIGLALQDETPAMLFVVGAPRLEPTFHAAWIAGLVLGAVAACWDEMLRTRELLAQRPIAPGAIAAARLRAVLLVLWSWFVLAPAAVWVAFAVTEDGASHTRAAALAPMLATIPVAASAAAIGLAAGALPAPWWQRLAFAAAWLVVGFTVVENFARDAGGAVDWVRFVLGHTAIATFLFVVAARAARESADADRPWSAPMRWLAALPAAAVLALAWAAFCKENGDAAVNRLHRAYPEVVRADGRVMLARRRDEQLRRVVVDAEHRPTGVVLAGPAAEPVQVAQRPRWWGGRSFGFEAPRRGWVREAGTAALRVMLVQDGHAFVSRLYEGVAPTGRGAERAPFAPGSRLDEVGDALVAVDAATGAPWRFDGASNHFVPLPLPGGEQRVQLDTMRVGPTDDELRAQLIRRGVAVGHSQAYLRGDRGAYLVRDGAAFALPEPPEPPRRAEPGVTPPAGAREAADPLVFPVRLPAGTSPGFEHEFRPRTVPEWASAGTAMVWSVLRPPVLLAAGSFGALPERTSWLSDPLTAAGRRPWLVFTACVLAGLAAWRTRRRLRSLGAHPATVHGWTVAVALLGVPALLVSFGVERARAYARREVAILPPAPRIVSPSPQEVSA